MAVQAISKEALKVIPFASEDVLTNEVDKKMRRWKLERAMKLGNLYKHPVQITFTNKMGERMKTTATIWAVTEEYVVVKGGNAIPVRSIYEVEEC